MTRRELIDLRAQLRDLLSDLPDDIDIDDLPEGSRLHMLDAADFAERIEYRLREAVRALADRDGL